MIVYYSIVCYIMVYYSIVWHIMVYYSILWYIVIYYGLSWFFKMDPARPGRMAGPRRMAGLAAQHLRRRGSSGLGFRVKGLGLGV